MFKNIQTAEFQRHSMGEILGKGKRIHFRLSYSLFGFRPIQVQTFEISKGYFDGHVLWLMMISVITEFEWLNSSYQKIS